MPRISQRKKDLLVKKSLESPLSQHEFCKEHGVALSSLYKWTKKYQEKSIAPEQSGEVSPIATHRFIEAVINDQPMQSTPSKSRVLIITTPTGCVIEVPL